MFGYKHIIGRELGFIFYQHFELQYFYGRNVHPETTGCQSVDGENDVFCFPALIKSVIHQVTVSLEKLGPVSYSLQMFTIRCYTQTA